jgi:hypothetical protein
MLSLRPADGMAAAAAAVAAAAAATGSRLATGGFAAPNGLEPAAAAVGEERIWSMCSLDTASASA